MESINDEENTDFISCDEDGAQDRLSVRVASLEKLVDYCAEEFSKLVFMFDCLLHVLVTSEICLFFTVHCIWLVV